MTKYIHNKLKYGFIKKKYLNKKAMKKDNYKNISTYKNKENMGVNVKLLLSIMGIVITLLTFIVRPFINYIFKINNIEIVTKLFIGVAFSIALFLCLFFIIIIMGYSIYKLVNNFQLKLVVILITFGFATYFPLIESVDLFSSTLDEISTVKVDDKRKKHNLNYTFFTHQGFKNIKDTTSK